LLRLRGVDLQRENFAAMGTTDVSFDKKLHVEAVLVLKHRTNKQALESKRLYNFLERGVRLRRYFRTFRIAQITKVQLLDPSRVGL
jgi:hypothetical protein